MLHDGLEPQPGLLCSGDDLVGWQNEGIETSISQLKRECILDAIIICPVNSVPLAVSVKSKRENTLKLSSFQG